MLAANARGRERLLPCPEPERRTRPDASWARCTGRLGFVAVLHDEKEVRRLLEHLCLRSEPRPLQPARGPPDPHETLDFP